MSIAVLRHVEQNLPQMLESIAALVNLDTGTGDAEGIRLAHKLVEPRLHGVGLRVKHIEAGPYGTHLLAEKTGRGPHLLLIGHLDTVFPAGTVVTRPFRTDGNRAYGPGVYDAKSSVICMLYALDAMRTLEPAAYDRLDLEVFISCDEENLSPTSAKLVQDLAAKARAALVFEPSRPDGSYVTHRKGAARYRLTVTGRPAHAGLNPERGASAIYALARKIVAFERLTNLPAGTTVNVGVIKGGQAFNVVAPSAEAELDMRAWQATSIEELDATIQRIASEVEVPGTSSDLERQQYVMPMERTAATDRLLAFVELAAAEFGEEVRGVGVGGVTDGNNAAQGTATIDGFGPIGDGAHTPHEYIELPSVATRTARDVVILRNWAMDPPQLQGL